VGPDLKVATLLQRYLFAFDVNMQVQDAAGKSVSTGMPSAEMVTCSATDGAAAGRNQLIGKKRGNERERRHK